MKKRMLSMAMMIFCSVAHADVTPLDNTELASVVVQTQQEQLQPVLPEYNANGQVGAVAAGALPTTVVGQAALPTQLPFTNPIAPTLPPPVVAMLNQIFNVANQSR